MRAESIPAAIDRGYVRGDHLVLSAGERPVREMQAGGGLDRGQEIGSQAHRLEDRRHDANRALRLGRRVKLGQRTRGVRFVDRLDPGHEVSNEQTPKRCQKLNWSRDSPKRVFRDPLSPRCQEISGLRVLRHK